MNIVLTSHDNSNGSGESAYLHSLTQYRELEEASDIVPKIWPHWMTVHAHLKDHKMHNGMVPFLKS